MLMLREEKMAKKEVDLQKVVIMKKNQIKKPMLSKKKIVKEPLI